MECGFILGYLFDPLVSNKTVFQHLFGVFPLNRHLVVGLEVCLYGDDIIPS